MSLLECVQNQHEFITVLRKDGESRGASGADVAPAALDVASAA